MHRVARIHTHRYEFGIEYTQVTDIKIRPDKLFYFCQFRTQSPQLNSKV